MQPEKELHGFPCDVNIKGASHHYRITENDGKFGIEQDGEVIATVQNHPDNWRRLSGAKLGSELLGRICNHIEAHYF